MLDYLLQMRISSAVWYAAIAIWFLASCVNAHGYLAEPPARNIVRNWAKLDNCPTCYAGSFSWKRNPRYKDPGFNQFCGNDANLANSVGVQRNYKAGEIAEFAVGIKVNHQGHYEFRICDRPITGADKANPALAQACLNKNLLMRATPAEIMAAYPDFARCVLNDPRPDCQPFDPRHPERVYIPAPSALSKLGDKASWKNKDSSKRFQEMSELHVMHFKIPKDLQCNTCTLQWWWATAFQSCIPDGDYITYFDGPFKTAGWTNPGAWLSYWAHQSEIRRDGSPRRCRDNNLGEEWINCADISVKGHASPPPAAGPRRRRTSGKQPGRRPAPLPAAPRRRRTAADPASPSVRRRRRVAQQQQQRRRRRVAAAAARRRRRAVVTVARRRSSSARRRRLGGFSSSIGDFASPAATPAVEELAALRSEIKAYEAEEQQAFSMLKKEEKPKLASKGAGAVVERAAVEAATGNISSNGPF